MSDPRPEHPKPLQDYLIKIGAEVINFRRAVIRIYKGKYYDEKVHIDIKSNGTIDAPKEYAPTAQEAVAIKEAFADWPAFPTHIGATEEIFETLKANTKGTLFAFWDRKTGLIDMVQEKRIHRDGSKSYHPWTYYADGRWISLEPEAGLPFYKPRYGFSGGKIMVHEGAQAALAAQAIADDLNSTHPWASILREYEHWGLIGGALAPQRSKYQELKDQKPREVVYVCDNDRPGGQVLEKFSFHWQGKLKGVRFNDSFKPSWDMADPLPEKFFNKNKLYVGPPLENFMEPATWATKSIPSKDKGRPKIVVRDEFAEEWSRTTDPEILIHNDWPNRLRSPKTFNLIVRPFSHVDDTNRLLASDNESKHDTIRYNPNQPPGIFMDDLGLRCVNTYVHPKLEPLKGDASMWVRFLEQLIPVEQDRTELIRWCSTLICRPEIKMSYAVLLISQAQGIGKGTLCENILAPLMGSDNVSFPTESDLVDSQYNYWIAHKRLAIVHEIYAGHSSKAYNKLKSVVADKKVTVNQKYMPSYKTDNWVHLFCCSNSLRALKLSTDDRRWFIPRMVEEKPPTGPNYWDEFYHWLDHEGGLRIIHWWLEDWLTKNRPVQDGHPAPASTFKEEIKEESRSPGQELVVETLLYLKSLPLNGHPLITTDKSFVNMIKYKIHDGLSSRYLEKPSTILNIAKEKGWLINPTKDIRINDWGEHNKKCRVITLDPEIAQLDPLEIKRRGIVPFDLMSIL